MSGPLTGKRVAYVPYTRDLTGPGDRRRFVHYAKLRSIPFDHREAPTDDGVVVLSSLSDVTHWSRLPRGKTKLVFDLPDSYLDIDPKELHARLRGPTKFLLGQHRHLEWDYQASLAAMCRRADAVVCSTPEQAERIRPFNANVHPILDFHFAAARAIKTDFSRDDTLHLVWEGMGVMVFTLRPIARVLQRLAARRRVALHLVTDLEYKPFNGPLPKRSTRRVVDSFLRGVPTYLYDWNERMFSTLCTRADLAVIPMLLDRPIFRAKAENKLLLFWRMAVPTITSATPAYVRTMRDAGVDMTCTTDGDWETMLERYADSEEARKDAALKGRRFADATHGETAVADRWDAVFRSLDA